MVDKYELNDIMKMIDHTNLKQGLKLDELKKLCDEAIKYGFCSVCVHPSNVAFCKHYLKNSSVLVCTVIGFPLGENKPELKAMETKLAIADGADEIDMVISNSMVKRGDYDAIREEVDGVCDCANGKTVKVIIETCLLTKEEIVKVSETLLKTKADFVKTSTGFCGQGATRENVALIKSVVGEDKKIKAAGGIAGAVDAVDMIKNGATRLGTSKGALVASELLNGSAPKKDVDGAY